jgi:acyl-coenzyme A synthetase/AMP-(fatty) acid ligase
MTSEAASFAELLARAAVVAPAGGVEDATRRLDYRGLERAADALALRLGSAASVALLLPTSLDLVIALAAASRAGTVLVLNPGLSDVQLQSILETGQPDTVVTTGAWSERVRTASEAPAICCLRTRDSSQRPRGGRPARRPRPAADEPRLVLYTSGTTGVPKGVVHLQRRLIANARAVAERLHLDGTDVALMDLPLHHSYGLNHLLAHVAAGASVCLSATSPVAGLAGPTSWWGRVTNLPLVPATLRLLLRSLRARPVSLPRLRFVMSAGGPLPPALVHEFFDHFPELPLFNNYGQTEAGPRISVAQLARDSCAGSVGEALPGVSVRIAGDDGTPLQPGEEGEVVVDTPSVMLGYLGQAEDSERALAGGWLRTGDRGRIDGAGRLTLTGRIADVVHCAGVRVTAVEIEEALLGHPSVAEAAVVAVPHVALGEIAKAFVVPALASSASSRDLRLYCRHVLAPVKVPREIVFVNELPRTASGKVMKGCLK